VASPRCLEEDLPRMTCISQGWPGAAPRLNASRRCPVICPLLPDAIRARPLGEQHQYILIHTGHTMRSFTTGAGSHLVFHIA
jgi:hypothetical protein